MILHLNRGADIPMRAVDQRQADIALQTWGPDARGDLADLIRANHHWPWDRTGRAGGPVKHHAADFAGHAVTCDFLQGLTADKIN